MGNALGKISVCFAGDYHHSAAGHHPRRRRRHHHELYHDDVLMAASLDEGLGHSFCYIRPDSSKVLVSSKVHHSDEPPAFRSISGASVSANTSTLLSTELYSAAPDRASAAAFESSNSFASIPLQPVPRWGNYSGPIGPGVAAAAAGYGFSGTIERGFMSGPIERGFLSGPLDRAGIFSGPLAGEPANEQFRRSFSHAGFGFHHLRRFSRKASVIETIRKAIYKRVAFRSGQRSVVAPVKGPILGREFDWAAAAKIRPENQLTVSSTTNLSSDLCVDDDDSLEGQNLQWAQGKAGEDRVHVVVSEEHGWVFVGIYDGFNGPDAPDFLLSNLYPAIHKELKGLLWEDKAEKPLSSPPPPVAQVEIMQQEQASDQLMKDESTETNHLRPISRVETENYPFEISQTSTSGAFEIKKSSKSGKKFRSRFKNAAKRWEENQRKWKNEWERERLELERILKEQLSKSGSDSTVNHSDVLKALAQALRKTEETFLDIADNMVMENPELSLMGSCVLVMLMKGDDVYLMNVGDSRAVVAQKADLDVWGSLGKDVQDLQRINEETSHDLEASDADQPWVPLSSCALQLSVDHSTNVETEVRRILQEHPDDAAAITNDRVKGTLKVTRAFGAGFLKQPKWNNALLEMFRIEYVGTSPYISCCPSLYHHRLGPKDRFLILSSDGLYQYFTNEEAVAEVETFITTSPEGDPAQHLVEEVIFRAAKKAGMDFHELLEIPQGDRRKYHDDVSIIVISLEGRIWKSCV